MAKIYLKTLLLVFSCSLFWVNKSYAAPDYNEKHTLVAMRMIGHQILLNSGDSSSLVLPIEKNDNRYKIQFESDFSFVPVELTSTIDKVAAGTGFSTHYFVEVESCQSGEVVYSYEANDLLGEEFIPCAERAPPKACYAVCITILDPLSEQPLDIKESSNYFLIIIGVLVLIIAIGLFYLLRRKKAEPPVHSDLIPIGKYRFDNRNMALLFENEKIELTGKEGDLLYILHSSANNTLKREIILNAVWGDEGDYVGRTLDVFVSKLRKKLEADANVKIINIRGVGYKLVVNNAG